MNLGVGLFSINWIAGTVVLTCVNLKKI